MPSPAAGHGDAPTVSVVLSCHNSERFLESTLASVLGQTYTDFELVAVDDCSTDATPALLRAAAERDPRVRVVRHAELGGRPSVTKNTALAHARGRYVCFIDHDDLFLPEKLEHSVALLDAQPDCVAVFHDVQLITHAGAPLHRYLKHFQRDAAEHLQPLGDDRYRCGPAFYQFQSLRYAALHTISTMIAVERVPAELLRFDTRYTVVDDTDMWIRLGLAGRIGYVDRVLAQYRQHDSNITRDRLKVDLDAVALMEANYARLADRLDARQKSVLRGRMAEAWGSAAWAMRRRGMHAAAARAYLTALRRDARPAYVLGLLKSWLPARSAS